MVLAVTKTKSKSCSFSRRNVHSLKIYIPNSKWDGYIDSVRFGTMDCEIRFKRNSISGNKALKVVNDRNKQNITMIVRRNLILYYMKINGSPVSYGDVSKQLGINYCTVRNDLNALKDLGFVVKQNTGKTILWKLPK